MRVTFDTNILVSATLWNGPARKLLHLVEKGDLTLVLSQEILDECAGVLQYEKFYSTLSYSNSSIEKSIEDIIAVSEVLTTTSRFDVVRDAGDNRVLECAVDGLADYIITFDKELLAL